MSISGHRSASIFLRYCLRCGPSRGAEAHPGASGGHQTGRSRRVGFRERPQNGHKV